MLLVENEDTEGYNVHLDSVNEREFVTKSRRDKVEEAFERTCKEQNGLEA